MPYARWIKAHVMIGTKTNVVTSVEVTEAFAHDSKLMQPLPSSSAERFDMKRVSADKAYCSKEIVEAINRIGAVPLIPFKKNARIDPAPPNRKISMLVSIRTVTPEGSPMCTIAALLHSRIIFGAFSEAIMTGRNPPSGACTRAPRVFGNCATNSPN